MAAAEQEIKIRFKADVDSAAEAARTVRRALVAELRRLADELEGSDP